ncbi:MAG: cation-translocating P-type ATPase [Pseudomonadota bacterium]|nr:cation-translocating P-type ATPase [Pseudomonadota bacterium]
MNHNADPSQRPTADTLRERGTPCIDPLPHDMAPHWFAQSVAEVAAALATSARGLSSHEAAARLRQCGPNVLIEPRRRSLVMMLHAQFADLTTLVLIGAAVLSGFIGELSDVVVILVVVLLNAALGASQELRAERAMAALKAIAAPTSKVLRDGKPHLVASADLVPGDAVVLEAGDIVPADLRLTEAAGLRVNESALTGESVPLDKIVTPIGAGTPLAERANMAFKGTTVTAGRALGWVVASGMSTEFGHIASLLVEHQRPRTPLQRRLEKLGRQLVALVSIICALVFVTGILRGEPAMPMLLTALSLAVAAIPEALPAVVSIALALGARRMAANRALVRRLPAVETLGSVTYICSDKTGTLTTNEMRVNAYYCDGALHTAFGAGASWDALLQAMAISHDADFDSTDTPRGDPTEIALLLAASHQGRRRDAAAREAPRVAEIAFDAHRKRTSTVHRCADSSFLSITKGAAESLIPLCDTESRDGRTVPIDRKRLLQAADRMAAHGLRVLAFARRHWDQQPQPDAATLESHLQFLALVGLLDPPRAEVAEAVAACRTAGIVPVMITGDHPATARAIARRIGLLAEGGTVLTGTQLAALGDSALAEQVRNVHAYARVAPEQKVRIVTALQNDGQIVAMTGDGVNDGPALQRADIGVAMGITGTDVAREASAMVLLDDNFATIVGAVREGRRIYDNLRKFVRYILTTNSGEVWTVFLAPFLGLPVPLLPIQILWINLVTDSLPGIALTTEPAESDLMNHPPRAPAESLFARGLGAHALIFGMLMAALTLGTEAWAVQSGSSAWRTVAFTTLCFTQIGHVLAIRSERTSIFSLRLLGNVPLLFAVSIAAALQLLVVYIPVLHPIFGTASLSVLQLSICIATALIVLTAVELEKALRNRRQSDPAA